MTTFAVMQTMESSLQTIVADRLIATKGLKEIGDLYAVSIVDTAHKVRSGALSWRTAPSQSTHRWPNPPNSGKTTSRPT